MPTPAMRTSADMTAPSYVIGYGRNGSVRLGHQGLEGLEPVLVGLRHARDDVGGVLLDGLAVEAVGEHERLLGKDTVDHGPAGLVNADAVAEQRLVGGVQ